jgi:threonine dehydrogenase-like Zn-dependent dehydrogenase
MIGDRMRIYGHDYSVDEGSGLYGGYADYMELLPGTRVHRLPGDPPAPELTIWEPLSIAFGWSGPVSAGDTVAILGPGHLGLSAIVAARAQGAATVVITGTSADGERLEAARRLGVDLAIDISVDDAVARVLELTDGRGADVVIDAASGSTSTVTQAIEMVRRRGTIVIGGMKDRKPVEGFVSDWIPIKGICLMPGIPDGRVEKAVELLSSAAVPTPELVGEVFVLEQVGEALEILDRKTPGRDAIRVGLTLS